MNVDLEHLVNGFSSAFDEWNSEPLPELPETSKPSLDEQIHELSQQARKILLNTSFSGVSYSTSFQQIGRGWRVFDEIDDLISSSDSLPKSKKVRDLELDEQDQLDSLVGKFAKQFDDLCSTFNKLPIVHDPIKPKHATQWLTPKKVKTSGAQWKRERR